MIEACGYIQEYNLVGFGHLYRNLLFVTVSCCKIFAANPNGTLEALTSTTGWNSEGHCIDEVEMGIVEDKKYIIIILMDPKRHLHHHSG